MQTAHGVSHEPGAARETDWSWIAAALLTAAALRALVLAIGPLSVGGDGTVRLLRAIAWAQEPRWEGLSGVWPPLHWYIVGSLIRLWPEPLFWSFSLGMLSELGTVYLMYRATKRLYGDARVAGWSALLLALYWTHASMVGSNFVEVYYLYFVVLAIDCAVTAGGARARHDLYGLGCGVAMAIALLLRHEAKLLWPIFLLYLWRCGGRRSAALYVVPSGIALVWQMFEPWLTGEGYAQWIRDVSEMKALDQLLTHQSLVDALKRWVLMPASSPSFVVVLLAIVGVWTRRRAWTRELFLLMFVVQVGFYFVMTLVSSWNPQQRYVMLYFVNLLPYAAIGMAAVQRRSRVLAAALLALAVLVQGVTWMLGRNTSLPFGWLPVQLDSPSQVQLDRWVRTAPANARVYEIAPYALRAHAFRTVAFPWDARLAILRAKRTDLIRGVMEPAPRDMARLNGGEPLDLSPADIVLVNPQSPLYELVLRGLPPGYTTELRDDSLQIIRVHPPPG